ncbi:type I polyketide synthase [Nocardiopsis alba]|uniref:type I polyketide synthase n=2 Tax=Nocardiopsis alba TaxID=53437 RepID=UPI0033A83211
MTNSNERLVAALRASVRENERLKQADREPIAIVAMSCRCPGGVSSPEQLWDLVDGEREGVGPLPTDRGWDLDRLYHPDPDHQGTCYVTKGGFIEGADRFDPDFFGISPREAEAMDPQQRLMLEISWEAVERAGIVPRSLKGTDTGVFLGAAWQGYGEGWRDLEDGLEGHLMTGMSTSVISGRVAYTLGLEGPAVTIDTGCSSSFVALHLAAQSLRRGETSMAIVGGAAIMAAPISLVGFSRHRALAHDARCKAFSADADGMGLGEGAGVLLLERLSDARRKGHPVLAVIMGSAINQDGASNGMAAPNGTAQQRVIRQALAAAGISPDEVDTVEAHGTGTRLGDPIEAEALSATYGRDRPTDRPLWIGSLKSNIGHPQAAAGVLSVIKTVQAMRHGVLPRTLHTETPTPDVDWSAGTVALLGEARPWTREAGPRTAGVSSFGVSGTNAHVILREPPVEEKGEAEERVAPAPALAWTLSGRGEEALRGQAERLRELLDTEETLDPRDVAHTLATARTAFEHRAAIVGSGIEDLRAGLDALIEGGPSSTLTRGTVRRGRDRRTVFMFPGQGSQWLSMARRLLDESPEFAERMAECDRAIGALADWSPVEAVRGEDAEWMDRVDRVQPVLFSVMVSLAAMWRSAGVEPDAVIGHSQGEIAAACVAGALSLEDAVRVVVLRSSILTGIAGRGGMTSVQLSPGGVRERLESHPELSLAAANGAVSTVVSGPPEALTAFERELEAEGTRVRRVPVDYASHSAHVETLREELLRALAPVSHESGDVPFYSTVTGDLLDLAETGPEYWYRNLRSTVDLETVTRRLVDTGHDVFLEISPHPVLTPAVSETLDDAGRLDRSVVTGTLRRDQGGLDTFLRSVCELHVGGVEVAWDRLVPGGRRVDLPTYAFQRRRYWLESRVQNPAATTTGSWRYQVTWRRTDDITAPALEGDWIVAVPSGHTRTPLVDDAIAALNDHGARAVPLELDAEDDDRAAIAERLRALDGFRGVLSLLALDDEPAAPSGRSAGLTLNVALLQALVDTGGRTPLWTATRAAVSVAPGDPLAAPDQATTWGLGRIAALEHPGCQAGLIDLPERLDARSAGRLVSVLSGATAEPQTAVRDSGVYARRLIPAAEPVREWTPRGTVLVTGGTGALGGHVARRFAREGAEHIVLVGRRGEEAPGVGALREELTGLGARVTVAACDTADREALRGLLDGLESLDAVVHTAGVLDDGLIDGLTPERCDSVFGPKVASARNLHDLTRDRDLDAFVLFSSFAGTLGGPGQGGYAAANAYLDALARHRRDQGLPATSIAWGAWAGGGLVDEETAERLRRTGMPAMDPERAVDALIRAVGGDDTAVAVADIDWDLLAGASPMVADSPIVGEIPALRARRNSAAAAGPGGVETETSRWAGLSGAERTEALTALVVAEAAAALGHDAADLDTGRAFRDLGFDSLTAVDLRNRMAAATGVRLPVTLVFDYPTVEDLVDHLSEELPGGADDTASSPAAGAIGPVSEGEPIAIVSVGCRMPGGVSTPEELWRLLEEGADVVGDFPRDRGWDVDGLYDPDPDVPGTYYVRGGGFLTGAADFDADFFGISPREALAIDPQQRLLLETAWEVFERAGIDPRSLKGSRTGVYVGASYNDYGARVEQPGEHEGYLALGSASSVASGRVSYTFGLEGPAVTVDTACSSSLVALHLAVQALRRGECEMALSCGVVVMSAMDTFVEWSRQGAMAPDGRCKAFSADADGAGWAEGAGVVLLEPLSRARRLGHRVLGLVRGSAVNQDGASNGLTAPNGPSQQRVVRAALADAGLEPGDVDAVEAHGTGTPLGDPIEAEALERVYGAGRERPLWLGSLKSNIGHTQAASGIAGVIKMTLALQNGLLPRTLHAERPSTHIDWEAGNLALLTEPVEWARGERARRAGVSSFGVSGTNAHVVLEEAPVEEPAESSEVEVGPVAGASLVPWVVSGRGPAGLRGQAERLAAFARADAEDPLNVAAALAGRTELDERAVLFGADTNALAEGLEALASGIDPASCSVGRVSRGRVGFVFPGQGSQRSGMGRGLYERFPVFREAFDEAIAELEVSLGSGLREVVWGEDGEKLGRTVFTQAGLFAVEVALFRLLESRGVEPDVLMGHSIGELAAAHVAGVWSLSDAARVVAARGRLMQALPSGGVMASVDASEERVREAIVSCGGGVDVAAVNGPVSVVISGVEESVAEVESVLSADGCRVRRLRVSHAFHSVLMEPMLEEFERVLREVSFAPPRRSVISNLTGRPAEPDELCSPEYWVRHVRSTVRFADGVRAMAETGVTRFVEVGPDSGLLTLVDAFENGETVLARPMRREVDETEAFLRAVADLWVCGVGVDWSGLFAGADPDAVALPTYAFQRERFWLDAVGGGLVSEMVEVAGAGSAVWSGRLSVASHPWLSDHAVSGRVLLPGTAFLDLALRAAADVGCAGVEELTLRAPLILPERGVVELQVVVDREGDRPGIEVYSRPVDEGSAWVCHASGTLGDGMAVPDTMVPGSGEELPVEGLYERLEEGGFGYGPAFQGLRRAWRDGDGVVAEAALPREFRDQAGDHVLHPALLDAAMHALSFVDLPGMSEGLLPFSWSGVRVLVAGAAGVRVRIVPLGGTSVSLLVVDAAGGVVAVVEELALRPVGVLGSGRSAPLYRLEWRPEEVRPEPGTPATLLDQGADPTALAALPHPAPETVVVPIGPWDGDLEEAPARARDAVAHALDLVQAWLADERFAESRLVFAATGPAPDEDIATASVRGLVRSAQNENPGRFALAVVDGDLDTALPEIAAPTPEPELLLKGGERYVRRLVRSTADDTPEGPAIDGAALVTGATGRLGALVARHLVERHGVRGLVLAGRRGAEAPGMAELREELTSLGAVVTVVACDITDTQDVQKAIAQTPGDLPLKIVVHAAGVLDDGVVSGLTPERIATVMRPKIDGAVNLWRAVRHLDPAAFVLFSSVSGVLGGAGQAGYAAANSALDALAARLRSEGAPAISMAWGMWAESSGMTGELGEADLLRVARSGVAAMATDDALDLFDTALRSAEAVVAPVELDMGALRAAAKNGSLAHVLRGLVPSEARKAAPLPETPGGEGLSLADRIAGMAEVQAQETLSNLVRDTAATILGHASVDAVDPDRGLLDIGFDSLTAVELRNRLGTATGLRLPVTLLFDHPSVTAIADHLRERMVPDPEELATSRIDDLERRIREIAEDAAAREQLTRRLRAVLDGVREDDASEGVVATRIESASDDEMFAFIDQELGISDE